MSYKASVNINFTEDTTKGYLNFGAQNDLPNIIIELVNSSNIAQSALNTKSFFLRGEGFVNKLLNAIKVNEKETILELLKQTAIEYSYFEGYAYKVFYNIFGKVAKIELMPFETLRLGLPNDDGIVTNVKFKLNWNPQKGQKQKNQQPITYDLYNPLKENLTECIQDAIAKGVDYCQVLYVANNRPGARQYPIPQYMSGDWINIDGEISKFHYTNLLSGFFNSALVTLIGKQNGIDANGKDSNLDAKESIMGAVGSENAGNVAIVTVETKEQAPTIQTFGGNANHDLFLTLQNLTTENISIATQVPKIIMGIETAGKLGQSNEIENTIQLFQNHTITPTQRLISETFSKLFSNWQTTIIDNFEIANAKLFNSISDKLLDVLTEDEKRKLIGYDPKPKEVTV